MNFQQQKNKLVWLFCVMLVILGIPSCLSKGNVAMVEKNQSFLLVLLRGEKICSSPELGNSWETAWPVLQKSYPLNVVHRVNLDGIETYNWMEQIITLTDKESGIFSSVIRDKEVPSLVCPYAFLVLLDNTPIYGGKIIFSQSAMAIQYPVIYLGQDPEKLSLIIRPFHSIFQIEPNNPAWQIINDARIEDVLLQAGKLVK